MLEPKKDEYDFSMVKEDLSFLKARGKELFIQLNDATFDSNRISIPNYLLVDSIYNGGASPQYEFISEEQRPVKAGWTARRWDPKVRERFQKLFMALGKEFDGKIAGINLQETAIGVGERYLPPKGFSYEMYRDGLLDNMKALKKAFLQSDVIQYANFMPGGYVPGGNTELLKSVYEFAKKNNIGVGGPDILVNKPGQMRNSYGLVREASSIVPTGVAVQDGNYDHVNPKTGKQVSIQEIYEFAKDYLKLKYVFWCIEEPYYSRDVIPFLQKL